MWEVESLDNIYFEDRQDILKIDRKIINKLKEVIITCLEEEGLSIDTEVSVSFVTNEEIRELNRDYRGLDKETDVLSFPMEDEFEVGVLLLGDIIISTKKAIDQASDFGHSVDRELAYLTAHSMFHLMGYDHINESDKLLMRNKEKEIMRKLEIFK